MLYCAGLKRTQCRKMAVQPYQKENDSSMKKAEAVQLMFDSIAHRYDLLNDLMTAGMHRRWKRLTVKEAVGNGANSALDIACGTGDLGFLFKKSGVEKVTGIDFSENMLKVAARKVSEKERENVLFSRADALELPFQDDLFEAVATGFSLRNVDGISKMFAEVFRVLKPGGRFVSLELTHMKSAVIGGLFRIYFNNIVPILGGFITGDREAYDYLPESIANVPNAEEVGIMMEQVGFSSINVKKLGFGSVALVRGIK